MLNVFMLSVVMLNEVMLSVMGLPILFNVANSNSNNETWRNGQQPKSQLGKKSTRQKINKKLLVSLCSPW